MLRPATDDDVERMRAWRNQAANREVSLTQHEIGAEEHAAWWQQVAHDDSRRVLIYEVDGRPLGVVNLFDLDPEARTAAWGFYLDHETTTAEGTAMLAWMQVMREAVAHAFDDLGLLRLDGEVLEHNASVRAMNRRFRFTEGEPEQREVDGVSVTAIPISLRAEDRRTPRKKKETP